MPIALNRVLAGVVVAATATIAGTVCGLVGPAQATEPGESFWVERHSDHIDIVVDWYAVPAAAQDAENNLVPCAEAFERIDAWWLVDQLVCINFVQACAEKANTDPRYVGRPIRVSFYPTENRCAVMGVG